MRKYLLLLVAILSSTSLFAQVAKSNLPEWAKNVIWYQIFVERFNNGDPSNDPTPENTTVPDMKIFPPDGWQVSKWTSNWFERQPWELDPKQGFNSVIQSRRYGGDLQGVMDKLDYLQELGVSIAALLPAAEALQAEWRRATDR